MKYKPQGKNTSQISIRKKMDINSRTSKHSVKKKRQSSKKKQIYNGMNSSNSKQSKWVKQPKIHTNYEQWKKQKRARHVRQKSEQLFSTMKENVQTVGTRKNRKKLSIDISKNVPEHGHSTFQG
jgi:hypothetical protein